MSPLPSARPALLARINERGILRTLLMRGPLSRADLARITGMSPPTVSKAAESLLETGLVEELDAAISIGRPARRLALSTRSAQVLGLVVDAESCRIVAAGLDGQPTGSQSFPTPDRYEELIDRAVDAVEGLVRRAGVRTLGLGVSVPGLVDYREQRSLLSPNVPVTDGRQPARDLASRLDVVSLLVQEEHALCLAERMFGEARGLDDFAMLDVSTGVGLGVVSGGRLLTGHSGLAGEIGHVTVDPGGRRCGCGNFGCLETVAADSALMRAVAERLGRRVPMDELESRWPEMPPALHALLDTHSEHVAVAVAAVINLFNPSSLFVHGRVFTLDAGLFGRVIARAAERALKPSFADCRIVRARGSKRQGALAAIIEHCIESVVPDGPANAVIPGWSSGGVRSDSAPSASAGGSA
jgi:predicted NBD/HSP70 family sugar kinase